MTAALDLLARDDKWYLSAGEGLIWAPVFPVWLDAPGFWDEARLFEYALQPLFSVAFVDDSGREIELRALRRRWTPAALEVPYAPAQGLELAETRMVLPGFVLGSEWQIVNVGVTRVQLHAIAWATAPGEDIGPGDVAFDESELSWTRTLKEARSAPLALKLQLAMARGADSWGAVRAERTADHPHFALTPFWDRWDPLRGGLRSGAELAGRSGQVYLGVHRAIDIEPGSAARLAVARRAQPELPPSRARAEPPAPRRASSFHAASRASWEGFFETVPTFRCSDPYFERYWAYRWYGLRLGGLAAGWGSYVAPSAAAGIGAHHVPAAEAVPCHLRELRWAKDPEWARGVLRTLVAGQRADGSLPDRIGVLPPTDSLAGQADLGGALEALDAVHPSDAFLREVLPALERYAAWLLATQDADSTGLIDAPRQESREGARDSLEERADEGDAGARLKSVDLTVNAYEVCRALAVLGARGGLDGAPWRARADKTHAALLKRMWDGKGGMFADVNVVTGRRSGARWVGSFYPYATDIVTAPHLAGFVQNLFDPRQFWKPFPASSLSGKDAHYDPDAAWKGRRLDRPWNGRVWPSANSRVADAIARVAIHHLPALRVRLTEFVTKFVRMMFWEGDASRPNSFEHYHPVSGRPSAYRGLDDCQQSWVNDLIVQYVIGLRPDGEGRCVVDPMPFGLDGFEATGLPMQGRVVDVVLGGEQVTVTVAGREAAKGRVGEPISVRL
ncbi:MAG: hypothetical protein ACHQX4_07715 [Gemmatimonadales bacterium]